MNMGEDALAAARALDAQRPAEAAAQLTKALGVTNNPLEIGTGGANRWRWRADSAMRKRSRQSATGSFSKASGYL